MQLVLVDDMSGIQCRREWCNRALTVCVPHNVLRSKVLKRKSDHDEMLTSFGEERVKYDLLSDILTDDVGSLVVTLSLGSGSPAPPTKVYMAFFTYEVLQKLWDRFHEDVKISLYFKYAGNKAQQSFDFAVGFPGLTIAKSSTGTGVSCSGKAEILCRKVAFDPDPRVHMRVVVEVPEISTFAKVMPPARKILEVGSFSDVTITAENGALVKGHKCFLSASSPVLAAMFKNEMEESKTGQLEMTDVSEAGVRAFLRYAYYFDLKMAKEDIAVAFDLFYIGHKYDIPLLEAEMRTDLLRRKDEEFRVEFTFRVYMFVRNIKSAVELKWKTLQILKSKLDELKALQECKELFQKPSNSEAAMEVFIEIAKSKSD